MKKMILVIKGKKGEIKLRRTLFWDIDAGNMNAELNVKIIVERVFTRGNIREFVQVREYYGDETIRKNIIKAGSLDKKSLNFVSKFFNIDKSEFLCYRKRQSIKVH